MPLLRRAWHALARLGAERRGNVAPLLAVSIIPLVAAVGLSIDGARGWLVKSRLSQAIDAAGLAGGRVISSANRDNEIRMFFNANFPAGYMDAVVDGPHISVDDPDAPTTITINATATIPTTFMRVVGQTQMRIRADSVIERADRGMELVLVMDNTGSMINRTGSGTPRKIDAVKDAAALLVNAIYGDRTSVPTLTVGVVPYVATVNIGSTNSAWTTERSAPSFNVTLTRSDNANTSGKTSTVCATVSPAGDTHSFHDGQVIDVSEANQSAYNGRFLIRLTDTTGCSITNSQRNKKFWYVISDDQDTSTPATGTIHAAVPPTDYSRGGSWSGCVEARPSPYEEVSAEALPETMRWVRYFWPSTRGVQFYNTSKRALSKYSPPSGSPTSYTTARYGDNDWGSSGYNGAAGMNPAVTDNVGSDYFAYGPNFGCGTPILPLQHEKNAVLASIQSMDAWGRSGTMANLGLAWGWRVLSPAWRGRWNGAAPGVPVDYGTPLISKVVVLLTDGKNEWVDYPFVLPGCGQPASISSCVGNNGNPNDADYTAYGRLAERRLDSGINTIALATEELDTRMLGLCTAMKAQGITIYTIVLENGNQDLYRSCASTPSTAHAYFAPSTDELAGIFQEIADQLANLRLAR